MKYIYGLNRSGLSIINYLNKKKEDFFCWDDNNEVINKLKKKFNNKIISPNNLNPNLISEAFITPGISLDDKKINILKKNKIKLFRDLELYSRQTKDKKIIAITGTNGKSTTAKLISDILIENNTLNFLGGNIGTPLLDFAKINIKIDYHVIELSSYQLESFTNFFPHISILLNITPDHLDRYKDFESYVSQKEKIISKINKYNIVSLDNKANIKIYNKYKNKIIPISTKPIENGIFFEDNFIKDRYFKRKKDIKIEFMSSSLYGKFNIENILAAYAVSKILNLKNEKFIKVVKKFKGLEHRLETIYKNKNMQIINNSKATNLDASINSVINYENISLIIGGRTKNKDFKKFLDYKKKISKIYLIGESSKLIYNQLSNILECEIFENLEFALRKVFIDIRLKKNYQTILFSPACSSFDQFKDFEDRGKVFKSIVKKNINAL